MNKNIINVLYGFLAWLIPFVASFFFYTREGKLTINVSTFKSIMVVVGTITAAILLVSYFKKIKAEYLKEGIIIGLSWFGLNILLDIIILIPMSKMPLPDYFMQIGLGYLAIPTMCIMVGAALANKQ
jgi:hypothetical protein